MMRFQSSARLKQENVHVNVDAQMEKSYFRDREQFSCTQPAATCP